MGNRRFRVHSLLVIACVLVVAESQADGEKDLAQASQNPVANLISVPFENNLDFNVGPEDGEVYVLNLKPVYPVNLGKLNLINRFIMPLAYQQERFDGEGSESGLGNLTYQLFLSPAEPGRWIWGVAPAFNLPTNTDERLGADKWSAGPAAVVLTKTGPWLIGSLWQHLWSFAGDSDENNVNFSSWQYFVNYNFDNGWYLSSTPTMSANWDADSGNRFTVPIGGGAGRVVRFGKLPVDMKLQGFYNAEKPDGAATWSIQFQFKLLFPRGGKN